MRLTCLALLSTLGFVTACSSAPGASDGTGGEPGRSGGSGGAGGAPSATGGNGVVSAGAGGGGGAAPAAGAAGVTNAMTGGASGARAGATGTAGTGVPTPGVDARPFASAEVSGYRLLVKRRNPDGTVGAAEPYDIRGVSWSPAGKGGGGGDFATWADRDLALMRDAGINTVKTYGAPDRATLDACLKNGILAIVTVLVRANDDPAATVNALKDHPAVLMWSIGNEWNMNRFYGTCELDACYGRVNEVAKTIKQLDPSRPVSTSFAPMGEIPTASDLQRLDAIQVWGLNIYSQPGFFGRFTAWRQLATSTGIKKPFYMSEYGVDAFDNNAGHADEAMQAKGLKQQTQEIRGQLSASSPEAPCLGGTPFEWNDEWWKSGGAGTQDRGGFPNIGVYGDQFANEDWWGVVDVDRKPRMAYQVLKSLYTVR